MDWLWHQSRTAPQPFLGNEVYRGRAFCLCLQMMPGIVVCLGRLWLAFSIFFIKLLPASVLKILEYFNASSQPTLLAPCVMNACNSFTLVMPLSVAWDLRLAALAVSAVLWFSFTQMNRPPPTGSVHAPECEQVLVRDGRGMCCRRKTPPFVFRFWQGILWKHMLGTIHARRQVTRSRHLRYAK